VTFFLGLEGSINISETLTGKCIAKITRDRLKFSNEDCRYRYPDALDGTTALFYNENRLELFTGTEHGNLFVWNCRQGFQQLIVNNNTSQ
jgi:hypothetical protein